MGLPPNSRKNSRQKPFQPAPGKDFEIESVPTIEARTKGFFLRAVVLAALAALSITGIYGLYYHQLDHSRVHGLSLVRS